MVSTRNWVTMCLRFAPRARRIPDLAGPLGHGRQHDVHDPDAPYQQGDPRDGAQHQVEQVLLALGLAQQRERNHDLVVLVLVGEGEQLLDHGRGGLDPVQGPDPHLQLVQLDLLSPPPSLPLPRASRAAPHEGELPLSLRTSTERRAMISLRDSARRSASLEPPRDD